MLADVGCDVFSSFPQASRRQLDHLKNVSVWMRKKKRKSRSQKSRPPQTKTIIVEIVKTTVVNFISYIIIYVSFNYSLFSVMLISCLLFICSNHWSIVTPFSSTSFYNNSLGIRWVLVWSFIPRCESRTQLKIAYAGQFARVIRRAADQMLLT